MCRSHYIRRSGVLVTRLGEKPVLLLLLLGGSRVLVGGFQHTKCRICMPDSSQSVKSMGYMFCGVVGEWGIEPLTNRHQ